MVRNKVAKRKKVGGKGVVRMTPLKQRRIELGMAQSQVAILAAVSQEAYSKYERGASLPDIDKALRIAKVLGFVQLEDLAHAFKLSA